MKTRSLINIASALLLASRPLSHAAVQVWDPDGATPGTGVSSNWDLTTPNWTTAPDAGGNTTWTQGNDASFNMASNYTVTVTQPITVGNMTLTGTAGTLTLTNTPGNGLTLAGSTLFNTGGRNVTIYAPIGGGFDLNKTNTGTLTLFGASTYSGGTTLAAGTTALGIDSAYSGGVVTSGPLGTGMVYTTNSAATISASGGARVLHNSLTMNIQLTIGGSQPITFTNGDFIITGGRTFQINNSADTVFADRLRDDGTARTLTKTGTGKLIMRPSDASTYLGGITASAGTIAAGSSTPFPINHTNLITFNASTLDLNGFDITVSRLAGNNAGSVLLGNNTLTAGNDQTSSEFSGVISGTGKYVKVGAISQVLSGSNTFNGGITISAGAVYFPTNGPEGTNIALGPGPNTITITGTGRIGVNRGSAVITNNIVLVSPLAGLDPPSGSIAVLAGLLSGSGGLYRYSQGSGSPIITADNSFQGGIQIDERRVVFGHRHAMGTGPLLLGNPSPSILPGNAVEIAAFGIDLVGADSITNVVTVNHNVTMNGNSFTNGLELSGPVTLAGGVQTNTATGPTLNPLFKISGVISGNAGFCKAGENTLVLSAQNNYSGPTIVDFGTLALTNTASVASSDIIISSGATLDVLGRTDGALTVGASQTLRGSGTVAGNVNVAGTLSPGQSLGTLTVNGNVTLTNKALFEIDKAQSPANDILIVGGTLTGGGTLTVTNSGATLLTNNDSFNLFSQAVSGFTTVTLPVGYTWNNQLGSSGIITVISRNWPLTPTNTVATVAGGNITISWPPNYAGGWVLDISTNLVDWDVVPGSRDSSSVTLPTSTAPASFYRMRLLTD